MLKRTEASLRRLSPHWRSKRQELKVCSRHRGDPAQHIMETRWAVGRGTST
jgi:hypothetical protein